MTDYKLETEIIENENAAKDLARKMINSYKILKKTHHFVAIEIRLEGLNYTDKEEIKNKKW